MIGCLFERFDFKWYLYDNTSHVDNFEQELSKQDLKGFRQKMSYFLSMIQFIVQL